MANPESCVLLRNSNYYKATVKTNLVPRPFSPHVWRKMVWERD